MHTYKERIFENEQQAKRFSYRVKGNMFFTQAQDNAGHINLVYVVRYTPKD